MVLSLHWKRQYSLHFPQFVAFWNVLSSAAKRLWCEIWCLNGFIDSSTMWQFVKHFGHLFKRNTPISAIRPSLNWFVTSCIYLWYHFRCNFIRLKFCLMMKNETHSILHNLNWHFVEWSRFQCVKRCVSKQRINCFMNCICCWPCDARLECMDFSLAEIAHNSTIESFL